MAQCPPPPPKYAPGNMHTRYRSLHLSIVGAPSRAVAYNIAKQQNIRCIASSLKFIWYGSMEWEYGRQF